MVRLIPFNAEAVVQMIAWAEREDMKDFFRRIPPTMDWCDVAKAMALFGHGYIVTVEGQTVGYAMLSSYDTYAKSIDMSVMIDQALVEKRSTVSEQAAVLVTNYAFDHVRCDKVCAKIMTTRNTLCKRLCEYGFKVEGTLRKSINNKDEWLLGCLKEDYKGER